MIVKRKLAIGMLSTIFSGWGTYELLKERNNNYSLYKKENNREKTHDNGNKDEKKNPETEVKPTETQTSDPKSKPAPKEPAPQQTYKDYILSKNQNTVFVDSSTEEEALKNILLHKMSPSYTQMYILFSNQMFKGSPLTMWFGNYIMGVTGKTIYIFEKAKDSYSSSLRDSCIKALNHIKPEDKKNESETQIEKLKEWCTVPTIKDILLRHKFKLPQNDDEWKQILSSDWIKDEKYHSKQSLFSKEEIQQLNKLQDDNQKIKSLQDKCTSTLIKPFVRNNFPAPVDFLGSSRKADEFQEAALFCTVPITAETYVKENIKSELNAKIPELLETDYCHEKERDVNYYKDIKTTDPMGGKSFWCAVRMIQNEKDGSNKKYR